MKIRKPFVTMLASGVSLLLWAQPKPSPTTTPSVEAPSPGETPPATIESDDQPLNQPSALGGFLRPGMSGGGFGGMANREPAGPVSVLCFKEPDQKALSETTEDLSVLSFLLSRNLEQAFAQDASDYKLGIPMVLTAGKQAVGVSYIQGFGAILKMQVRFPVLGPPEGVDEPQTKKTDSEWEEARRELLADVNAETTYHSMTYSGDQTDGQAYDAKLVQTLKNRVLVLLKNAANLRHVEGNEWIIVKIVGAPNLLRVNRVASITSDRPSVNVGQLNADETTPPVAGTDAGDLAPATPLPTKKSRKHLGGNIRTASAATDKVSASNRATIMTLRIKKSAADAFAAGTLSEDQFIKGAEAATYLNPVPANVTVMRGPAAEFDFPPTARQLAK